MVARTAAKILNSGEKTYRLSELAKMIDDEPCQKTIYNWCKSGFRGVKLEHILSPAGIRTSMEAYRRFQRAIQFQE